MQNSIKKEVIVLECKNYVKKGSYCTAIQKLSKMQLLYISSK